MLGKSKILDTNIDWYDEIDPISFYENHFARTFLSKIDEVYPDFVGVPFALKITSSIGETSNPDLAMIRKDYKEWYIIEAEMGRHSWDDHVEKQVRVFNDGVYEKKRISKYINSKNAALDLKKLEDMIDNFPPRVMVIVNEHKPDWEIKIKKYKSYLSVFQIYKGLNSFEIYRISGDTPFIYRDKSHCSFVNGLSNTMEIYTPTFITEDNDSEIDVTFKGKKTRWKLIKDDKKVHIVIVGRTLNLQLEKKYLLYLSDTNEYYLEIN